MTKTHRQNDRIQKLANKFLEPYDRIQKLINRPSELINKFLERYNRISKLTEKIFQRSRVNQYHQYYLEAYEPEKGLWAFEAFQICTDLEIEIPSWVLDHFYTISTDLIDLVDKAKSENITNDDILQALGLRQTVKGSRSGIDIFQRKKRDIDIFWAIENLKEQDREGKLKLLPGEDPFDIVSKDYMLSRDHTRHIYYEKKRDMKI